MIRYIVLLYLCYSLGAPLWTKILLWIGTALMLHDAYAEAKEKLENSHKKEG